VRELNLVRQHIKQSGVFIFLVGGSTLLNVLFTVFMLRNTNTNQFSNYSLTASAVILQSGLLGGLSVEVNRLLSVSESIDRNELGRMAHPRKTYLMVIFLMAIVYLTVKNVLDLRTLDAVVVPAFLLPSFFQAVYVGKLQFNRRVIGYAFIGIITPLLMIILAVVKVKYLPKFDYWSWIFLIASILATLFAKLISKGIEISTHEVLTKNLIKTSFFVFLTYWILRIDIFSARSALGTVTGDRYITISSLATTVTGIFTLMGLFTMRSMTSGDKKQRHMIAARMIYSLIALWCAFLTVSYFCSTYVFLSILEIDTFTSKNQIMLVLASAAPIGVAMPLAFSVIAIHRKIVTKLFVVLGFFSTIFLSTFARDLESFCLIYAGTGIVALFSLIYINFHEN